MTWKGILKRALHFSPSTAESDLSCGSFCSSLHRSRWLVMSSSSLGASSGAIPEHEDDTLTEEEIANLKLMRTESTGTLEGKPAKQRWQSLFKMFQEWKRETSIAQGQYALGGGSAKYLDEEINKVRAAIVSLQHKKTLPPSEQELLGELQHRLQQLLKAQRTLANA